jgi:hypothetical protein
VLCGQGVVVEVAAGHGLAFAEAREIHWVTRFNKRAALAEIEDVDSLGRFLLDWLRLFGAFAKLED